jgi:signal transduction histidine kinase
VPVRLEAGGRHVLAEAKAWHWAGASDEPASAPSARELAPGQLNLLLEEHSAVLELIAGGSSLEATLERVALAVARTVAPELCVIQWLESDGRTCRYVAAPDARDDELTPWCSTPEDQAGGARRPAGAIADRVCAALAAVGRRRGLVTSCSIAISGHNADHLGTLAVLDGAAATLGADQRHILGAMVQLARFAIETERRKMALRSANERFLSLAESLPGVVYRRVVRPDGDIRYTYISEGARDLFGVSPEEILSNPQALFDCHGPEYYATFRDRLMAASRALTLWDVEATIIARDGRRKFTHAIARPHRQADGAVVWDGIILDQTRIKEAEHAAAAAEARTRDAIIESIPQGLALFDADDRLVTWNSRFLDLYPALRDLIVRDMPYEELVRADIERIIDVPAPREEGGTAAVSADPGDARALRVRARLALHQKPSQVYERRLPDGRWILVNEHRTAGGGTVTLHTDVSELKAREAALERSNRELQMFASVASHDLQEPLRKIEAFGDRLERKCRDALSEDGRLYVDRMRSAATRMRTLINDLLDYSRVTTKARPFVQVDLARIAADVVADLQVTIEACGGRVEIDPLPRLEADPTQIRQLMQNLIANALKFHRPDQPPVVRLSAEVHGREHGDGGPAERCTLRIADNGIGFDTKYLERIFSIFQRLHGRNEYEGTGIGLATCRKIVERHRGAITAQSAPGEGATFIVTLPMRQPAGE